MSTRKGTRARQERLERLAQREAQARREAQRSTAAPRSSVREEAPPVVPVVPPTAKVTRQVWPHGRRVEAL
jgi:hypothetical protein